MNFDEVEELCEQIREGASGSDVLHWLTQYRDARIAKLEAELRDERELGYLSRAQNAEARASRAEAEAAEALPAVGASQMFSEDINPNWRPKKR